VFFWVVLPIVTVVFVAIFAMAAHGFDNRH
jgi:hypothetical protein